MVGLGVANIGAGLTGTFVVNGSPTKTADRRQRGRADTARLPHDRRRRPDRPALPDQAAPVPPELRPRLGRVPDRRRARRHRGPEEGAPLGPRDRVRDRRHHRRRRWSPGASSRESSSRSSSRSSRTCAAATARATRCSARASDHDWEAVPVDPVPQAEPGLVVYRWGASLYFANAARFEEEVVALAEPDGSPVKWLCVDAVAMGDVDYTGGETIIAGATRAEGARRPARARRRSARRSARSSTRPA